MTELITLNRGLTEAQRGLLARILDVLIPSAAGMPSATEVDVHSRWIDEALRLRPDLRPDLDTALELIAKASGATQSVESAVCAFAETQRVRFAGLGTLIAGAYYMDDRARTALGYPGQEARALTDETDTYLEMLERVVERGPIYRDVSS